MDDSNAGGSRVCNGSYPATANSSSCAVRRPHMFGHTQQRQVRLITRPVGRRRLVQLGACLAIAGGHALPISDTIRRSASEECPSWCSSQRCGLSGNQPCCSAAASICSTCPMCDGGATVQGPVRSFGPIRTGHGDIVGAWALDNPSIVQPSMVPLDIRNTAIVPMKGSDLLLPQIQRASRRGSEGDKIKLQGSTRVIFVESGHERTGAEWGQMRIARVDLKRDSGLKLTIDLSNVPCGCIATLYLVRFPRVAACLTFSS